MIVFPPTYTDDFIRCPVYARLRKTDWHLRAEAPHPGLYIGRALAKGLAAFYGQFEQGAIGGPGAEEIARQEVATALTWPFEDGESEWTQAGVKKLCDKALTAALKTARELVGSETVIGAEYRLPHSRPDLISRDYTGALIVTDTKYSLELDSRWRDKRISEYDTANQFWHYAWETEEFLGEPVTWFRLHLVTGIPCKSDLFPFRVDRDRLAFWIQSTEAVWEQMAKYMVFTKTLPPQDLPLDLLPGNWQTCLTGKYGRCVYYEFCHTFHRNPDAAQVLYIQRKEG